MGPLTEPAGSPFLELRDLSFRYPGGREALDGVGLDVHGGQLVAVAGPNGSGKTTLLRLAAGRLHSTRGSVRVLEAPSPPGPEALRRIGFAGADAVHRDALTGRENARFFAAASGIAPGPADEALVSLFDRLDLDEVADTPVEEYSRGMKRKLLLVEALAHRPDLIVLDEPFGSLDPPGADALAALLRERTASGAAVLLATHALARVPELADRVVFLHRGRVVEDAPPDDLLARHRGRPEAELRVRLSGDGDLPALAAPYRLEETGPEGGGGTPDAGPRERRIRVSWPRDEVGVSDLVVRLADWGVEIRELKIREPGLGRAFRELTGAEIDR